MILIICVSFALAFYKFVTLFRSLFPSMTFAGHNCSKKSSSRSLSKSYLLFRLPFVSFLIRTLGEHLNKAKIAMYSPSWYMPHSKNNGSESHNHVWLLRMRWLLLPLSSLSLLLYAKHIKCTWHERWKDWPKYMFVHTRPTWYWKNYVIKNSMAKGRAGQKQTIKRRSTGEFWAIEQSSKIRQNRHRCVEWAPWIRCDRIN